MNNVNVNENAMDNNAILGRIDFMAVITATNCNPNGDPDNGNEPRRSTLTDTGFISDVCIKRKIRNRLQAMGEEIFVVSDGNNTQDEYNSLADRCFAAFPEIKEKNSDKDKKGKKDKDNKDEKEAELYSAVCKKWIDVRTFGQLFAFKGVSSNIGVRGPVSIQIAESIDPVYVENMTITKSTNGSPDSGKASDTIGTKSYIPFGMYVIKGSISTQLATQTGFSRTDAEKLKKAIMTLFEGDESAARPAGSMEVCKFIWWDSKDKAPEINPAKVFRSVDIKKNDDVDIPMKYSDYTITVNQIENHVAPEVYDLA